MLRFISGLNPAPTFLRAMAAAFMLASFVLPSAALAASTSFDLIDPLGSGYGVTISLDEKEKESKKQGCCRRRRRRAAVQWSASSRHRHRRDLCKELEP